MTNYNRIVAKKLLDRKKIEYKQSHLDLATDQNIERIISCITTRKDNLKTFCEINSIILDPKTIPLSEHPFLKRLEKSNISMEHLEKLNEYCCYFIRDIQKSYWINNISKDKSISEILEIAYSISLSINPERISNTDLTADEMRLITNDLYNGFDVDLFKAKGFNEEQITYLRYFSKYVNDFTIFNTNHTVEQLKVILKGFENRCNVFLFIDNELSHQQMQVVLDGLMQDAYVGNYNNPKFSPEQMELILKGNLSGLDTSQYCNHKLSVDQMESLMNCLYNLVNTHRFNDPSVSAETIQNILNDLNTTDHTEDFILAKYNL